MTHVHLHIPVQDFTLLTDCVRTTIAQQNLLAEAHPSRVSGAYLSSLDQLLSSLALVPLPTIDDHQEPLACPPSSAKTTLPPTSTSPSTATSSPSPSSP